MKKQVVTKLVKNKEMNQYVYQLRRKVIDIIYDIKKEIELPRIEVRVVEKHEHILGVGRVGENMIWITEDCITHGKELLFHVVAHEIGHAVFKLSHNKKCPLMKPSVGQENAASRQQILKVLRKAV